MTGGRGRCGTANGRGSIRFRCHARRSRVARTSGGACQALPSTSLHGTRTTPGEAYMLQWLSPLVCTRRGSCLRGDRGRRVRCRQHGRPFTPTTVFAGCWRPPPAASCRLTALAAGATPPTFATSLPCNLRPARTSPAIRGRSMCWKPIPVNPPSSSPPAMAGMPCCGVWTGAAHRSCASPGAGGGEDSSGVARRTLGNHCCRWENRACGLAGGTGLRRGRRGVLHSRVFAPGACLSPQACRSQGARKPSHLPPSPCRSLMSRPGALQWEAALPYIEGRFAPDGESFCLADACGQVHLFS